MSNVFFYGVKEMEYLINAEPTLGKVISEVGFISREVYSDPFVTIVRNIISQQISTKAAETIFGRFKSLIADITPRNIINTEDNMIRSCGINQRKITYLKKISSMIDSKDIDLSLIPNMSDDEAIKYLSMLPGIGVWTAEMLLLFCYQRSDIVSYNDLIIKRGMESIYNIDKLSKNNFLEIRKRYSPYGSIASFYIWYVGNNIK